MFHGYGDVALFVPFIDVPVRLYNLRQRIGSVDNRF
jgi:hypothetical protein